jgi:hypothetical protein
LRLIARARIGLRRPSDARPSMLRKCPVVAHCVVSLLCNICRLSGVQRTLAGRPPCACMGSWSLEPNSHRRIATRDASPMVQPFSWVSLAWS